MIKKIAVILVFVFITSAHVSAQENKNVEIFDISKEKVIRELPSTPSIQKEAQNYLKGITSIYIKLKPIPDKGYMVKIPLEPPAAIQNQWVSSLADEVIIIFPAGEKPYLMIFDTENKLTFFNFEGKTDVLLKELNLIPNIP